MRRAARTDANHREIVDALRKVGCVVHDTSALGGGFPDLVVKAARVLLMEVKDGKKPPSARRLTPEQEKFAAEWAGHWVCVSSVDEAIKEVTR